MKAEKTVSKAQSLWLVSAAYVVAIGVAALWLVWGVGTGRLWLDTLIADVLATLVVFAFSRVYHNSSFYDAYWSVIPPLLLFYWWSQSGVHQLRCWLIAAVVVAWAVRLTANWVYAFPGLHHEDWRYPMFGASIPMMETRSLQRRPGYQDVIARVSRFVPRPPRRA
ncbi:MAG TPA: DUF1295 domain-containing protein [Mycobacterium sp.]|nr:DUF1295 domain-containing protein [Mycobacterium sp.]